jgi:hypothetical protein
LRFPAHHPVIFFVTVLCLSTAVAGLALWVFSRARTPFDYMVVGCLVATIGVSAAFAATVLRTARKSGRPS